MNNIPTIRKGIIIIIEPVLCERLKKIAPPAMADKIKITPPIISQRQEIISIAVRIKAGILCIINPSSFLTGGSSPPKTSSENIIIKRIARIVRTLGIQ